MTWKGLTEVQTGSITTWKPGLTHQRVKDFNKAGGATDKAKLKIQKFKWFHHEVIWHLRESEAGNQSRQSDQRKTPRCLRLLEEHITAEKGETVETATVVSILHQSTVHRGVTEGKVWWWRWILQQVIRGQWRWKEIRTQLNMNSRNSILIPSAGTLPPPDIYFPLWWSHLKLSEQISNHLDTRWIFCTFFLFKKGNNF